MLLTDLRKYAVRQRSRVRFSISNGMVCLVNEQGIARVPDLKAPPEFNLETELAQAAEFVIETADAGKSPAGARTVDRAGMERLVGAATGAPQPQDDE